MIEETLDAEVIPLPDRGDFPVERAPREPTACSHILRGRYVHEDTRTVMCKACREPLDAFTVLLEVVDHFKRTQERRESLAAAEAKRETHLAELRAEESKIKSRLRGAERREPENRERARILEGLVRGAESIPARDRLSYTHKWAFLHAIGQCMTLVGGPTQATALKKLREVRKVVDKSKPKEPRRMRALSSGGDGGGEA
jgi:hypothetical protein